MKKVPYIILLLLIPFTYLFTSFQKKPGINELTEKIISMMAYYVDEIPEEKVFLHLDKNLYAAGDNIWFSAFLTAGSPDVPSPLSKVLYVDLLDNNGNLLQQKTIRMEEGHGFGDIKLDPFTREGLYHIKAYSYWLKGFGDEAVFQTSIQVMDPYNLKFQPEVSFSLKEEGLKVRYTAEIRAVNNALQALAGENLKYELLNREKVLQSGNFELDAEGKHFLSFDLQADELKQVMALQLIQEENEAYSISRKFILPFPSSSLDVQFLPEGGDLIAGFNNKVAVRAIYPDGSPIQLKGRILSEDNEITFETNASGLGQFTINPSLDNKIGVELESSAGKFIKPLGEVKSKGINLAVDNSNPNLLNVLIQAKDFLDISPSGEALLVIHARGRIGYMQVLDLRNGVTGARVNKSQLPNGINQVTVFEPDGTPMAERLAYIALEQNINLELEATEVNTRPRGKNSWKLHISGEAFEGGNYSIAIVDATELPGEINSNIISYLKLESELKGTIHQPKQFFGSTRDDAGIDLVMLTHGWRRFNWQDVLDGKIENKNFIEQGINITGQITPKNEGRRGLTGGLINVFSKGSTEDFLAVEFGENGKFIIDDLEFQDTTLLTLSANDRRHKELVNLALDPPLSKYANWPGFNPKIDQFQISPSVREYLITADKRKTAEASYGDVGEIQIDEFVLESQKFDPLEEQITRMYGKGDASLTPSDIGGFEAFRDIWELLQGRFAGVRIIPDPLSGAPSIRIRGVGSVQAGTQPLILLDNVPIDASFASSIPPRDLAAVEIFKDAATLAVFGAGGANGAIALYSKRGAGMESVGDGVLNVRFPGYSVSKEFYIPSYNKENSPAPDYRTTLYWNPRIQWTDNSANIEFFNNDVVQKFKVVVQGMDRFGRLSYLEQEL
ncbi:TonB-dependent receptor plug domain-containing protein [Cecembia lonarensis]|uniref:Outer membrane cobalamin receptor protein n=1 Tax=Cecembia lonarensis (strain CCUG 58316 / KCTC 22772 / LW9) TaxID=1225176 RepID=K1L220_CECL9|nr:TonB-dependent receptor plug domain-containing protein [Cecembia lonarensis]EKB48781.1 Outer membrane cobalamin receptor protein [Cecembia lonarensis LW9]